MRRLGPLTPLLLAALLVTGCQVKVPSAVLRQAPNPCRALGTHRLAHLAGMKGTVSQTQNPVLAQAQTCEFKARAGTPILIMGAVDGRHLSFDQEVAKAVLRYQATPARRISVRGTDEASTMQANISGHRVPVMMAMHDGFLFLLLAITKDPARGPRIERSAMAALAHATS